MDKHQREQFIKEEPTDSINLLGLERILDSFKTMAAEMRAHGERSRSALPLHKGRRSYVLLPIDFGKPKKHALKMLAVLLEESQSKERFEKYSKKPFGEAKDRLKDLATWRLYRHCGNDWNKANDFADAHRKKTKKGAARPFLGSSRAR